MGMSQFGTFYALPYPAASLPIRALPHMGKTRYSKRYAQLLAALRQARKDAGLTQVQVASRFRTHASFVSKCESGERRIDAIELLDFCRLYRLTVAELLAKAGLQ